MKPFLCFANWKLNKTLEEAEDYFKDFFYKCPEVYWNQFVFLPPATHLSHLCRKFKDKVHWGAQNIFWEEEGAFTGEVSIRVLKELKVNYVLVGHSERRRIFQLDNDQIKKTLSLCERNRLNPVLCVGEKQKEKDEGKTFDVLEEDLCKVISEIKKPFYLAYEPLWAIGTGKSPSAEKLQEVLSFLRKLLKREKGEEFSQRTYILYGGSVDLENAKELSSLHDVDGFLVGGKSLVVDDFLKIFQEGRC